LQKMQTHVVKFVMAKKYKTVVKKEKVLKYLLKLERDSSNTFLFTDKAYNDFRKFDRKQIAQTLVILEEDGLIKIQPLGSRNNLGVCYITIREAGLTYFENKKIDKKNDRTRRSKDFWAGLITGLITGLIIMFVEKLIAFYF